RRRLENEVDEQHVEHRAQQDGLGGGAAPQVPDGGEGHRDEQGGQAAGGVHPVGGGVDHEDAHHTHGHAHAEPGDELGFPEGTQGGEGQAAQGDGDDAEREQHADGGAEAHAGGQAVAAGGL